MNNVIRYLKDPDNKNIILNIIGTFFIKGLSILISFFSFPIYIRFFSEQSVLGVWYTMLAILTWILTFDFGIGNGLRNKLVTSIVDDNEGEIKEYISTAYYSVSKVALIILFIGFPIIMVLNWNKTLNIDSSIISAVHLKISVLIVFITIIVQFVLRLINSIAYALQKPIYNNLSALFTATIQVVIVLLLDVKSDGMNLIFLAIANMFSTIIPLILKTVYIFTIKLKKIFPSYEYFDKHKKKEIMGLGGKIFYNQILYLLLTGFNTYLISKFFNPLYVVTFETYHKIYFLFSTIFSIMLTPFWSATTKAIEEKRYIWIKKHLKVLMILGLLSILGQLMIYILNQFIFDLWLGDQTILVIKNIALSFLFYGWFFLLHNVVSTFAMGLNKTSLQAMVYTFGVLLKLLILVLKISQNWTIILLIDNVIFLIYITLEYFSVKKQLNLFIYMEGNKNEKKDILSSTL